MDVLALELRVNSSDLAAIAKKYVRPADHGIEDFAVHISPQGVVVRGVYPLFISVKFETTWQLSVAQGKLEARLSDLRAMGVPATIFKSAVMKLFEDAARNEPAIELSSDRIVVDMDRIVSTHLVPTLIHLRAIRLEEGALILDAGPATMPT